MQLWVGWGGGAGIRLRAIIGELMDQMSRPGDWSQTQVGGEWSEWIWQQWRQKAKKTLQKWAAWATGKMSRKTWKQMEICGELTWQKCSRCGRSVFESIHLLASSGIASSGGIHHPSNPLATCTHINTQTLTRARTPTLARRWNFFFFFSKMLITSKEKWSGGWQIKRIEPIADCNSSKMAPQCHIFRLTAAWSDGSVWPLEAAGWKRRSSVQRLQPSRSTDRS